MSERRPNRFLDHRQRAFARGIAEGLSKANAQVAAGYKPNRKNANLLLRDERVLAEVARIRTVIELARYQRYGREHESDCDAERQK
jgi:hypothetical protein